MVSGDFVSRSQSEKTSLVGALGIGYLLLSFTSACIDTGGSGLPDGCAIPAEAKAIGIKQVFYSPYQSQRYATASDTVLLTEFGFNFELGILEIEPPNCGH